MNSSLTQQIINDSSLAATLATNGDRHLFFQAPQGTIRRLIYTATDNEWIPDPDPVAISDAKMLTPMAVNTPAGNQVTFCYHMDTSLNRHSTLAWTLLYHYEQSTEFQLIQRAILEPWSRPSFQLYYSPGHAATVNYVT